jgi:hypothetical protein
MITLIRSWRVLGASSLLLLGACNVIPHSGVISEHSISGHVVDAKTGSPIYGALVCVKYEKLGLSYYVRGQTTTDASGAFTIPASPERVSLLESPESPRDPSIIVMHPDYAPGFLLFTSLDSDRVVTIRMQPPSPQESWRVINCSTSAKEQ